MRIFGFILIMIFLSKSNANRILSNDSNYEERFVEDLVEIISRYYMREHRKTVLLYGSPPESLNVKLSRLNIDAVVMNSHPRDPGTFVVTMPIDFTENYIQTPSAMVIFYTDTAEEIPEGIVQISQTMFYSTDAKFVICVREKFSIPRMFNLFWWYYFQFTIILEHDKTEGRTVVYEYHPFSDLRPGLGVDFYGCWSSMGPDEFFEGNMWPYIHCNASCEGLDNDTFSENLYAQACFKIERRNFVALLNVFNNKSHDLNGNTITVFVVHLPPVTYVDETKEGVERISGKDGNLLRTLAKKMNYTIRHRLNAKAKNFQTFVGGLMDVAFRRCYFSVNSIYLIPLSYPPLMLSYPIEGSGLCFTIHRADLLSTSENLTRIFDRESLILVTVVFHSTVALFFFYLRRSAKAKRFDALQRGFLHSISLFLSLPVHWTGKNDSLRIFVFLIFWFIFVINFIFQGLIVSILSTPILGPEIDTFEQLYETGYDIEGYPSPDSILPPTSELFKGLNKRFRVNEEMGSCTRDLGNRMKKACWMDCLLADDASKNFRNDKDALFVHIGRDRIHSHYLTYAHTKDSPLKGRTDRYTKMIFEAGLMRKWRKDLVTRPIEKVVYLSALNLTDVQGCFYVLAFGHASAAFVFLLEWLDAHVVRPFCRFVGRLAKRLHKKITGRMNAED